ALLKLAPAWAPRPVRLLAWVGSISYSLYLLHQNLGVTLIGYLTGWGFPDFVAMAGASAALMAIAYMSFTYIEKPGAKLIMSFYGHIRRGGQDHQKESAPA